MLVVQPESALVRPKVLMSDIPDHGRRGVLAGLATVALGACSPLATINTMMPADRGARLAARDIAYGPDPRQKLDVYVPDGATAKAPVMMFIYGGGWDNGSKDDYSFVGHAFASRGFVTVVPDYRLVPQVRFPGFVEDCAQALRWVQDHAGEQGGDVSRVHLSGHSAGAYNAMMLALDRRFAAKAGVRPGLIRSVSGLAGPYDFLPLDDPRTVAAFGDYPKLAETQPVNFASRAAPRVFIATGDADTTVFPRNTYALARKLKAAGASVEVKAYPGIGHPGILLALGSSFRGNAPALDDIVGFALR
jgi:acetyl esterase/lipase